MPCKRTEGAAAIRHVSRGSATPAGRRPAGRQEASLAGRNQMSELAAALGRRPPPIARRSARAAAADGRRAAVGRGAVSGRAGLRGRADPPAEAARYGIALNEGVPANETISTAPKQPLAISPPPTDGARSHSQWMIDNDTFSTLARVGWTPAPGWPPRGTRSLGPCRPEVAGWAGRSRARASRSGRSMVTGPQGTRRVRVP
jgi:hypothetical protein